MRDYAPNDTALADALATALHERGITTPEAFREAFGIPSGSLTASAALVLVTTPRWVTQWWLAVDDPTPCVWVPEAVRRYAAVFGLVQEAEESDDAFARRLHTAFTFDEGRHSHGTAD